MDHKARLGHNPAHTVMEKDTEGFGNSNYKGEPCMTPLNTASAMATLTLHTYRPWGSFSQP